MNDRSVLKALIDVTQVLESLGVRFHIGGSMASAVHGEPRQTRGIDLVVDISQPQARELVRRLADRYYGNEDRAAEAVHRRRAFNLIDLQGGFKLDLFCLGDSAFDRAEFERAVALDLGDPPEIRVRVKTVEDTVLRKLLWYRDGGGQSDRQWSDVVGMLRVCRATIDRVYLQQWADELQLSGLLARADQESNA